MTSSVCRRGHKSKENYLLFLGWINTVVGMVITFIHYRRSLTTVFVKNTKLYYRHTLGSHHNHNSQYSNQLYTTLPPYTFNITSYCRIKMLLLISDQSSFDGHVGGITIREDT